MIKKFTSIIKFNICVLILLSGRTHAQDSMKVKKAEFQFKNGIGVVAPDSIFSINFRFRMQSRFGYKTISDDDFSVSEFDARVRRMRFRFEGFVVNPKLNYYVQLSVSRGDMDWSVRDNSSNNNSPNIVRDAVVIYKPNHNLSLFFGQTKLPGNRQRVVSSGEQQFYDRAITNATFNIDRDFGFQTHYGNKLFKDFNYVVKGALTTGDGRNANPSKWGLAYTGRLELLPLGKFTNKGDYFEGDLEREAKPKISLAGGYHYNENAVRTAGTLGNDLYKSTHMSAWIFDFLLKYKGLALSAEYLNRDAKAPISMNPTTPTAAPRVVYTGEGYLTQLSYIFKNNLELAFRYAKVTPYATVRAYEDQKQELGVGATKYLKKHRVKLQGNIFHLTDYDYVTSKSSKSFFGVFQIELGI